MRSTLSLAAAALAVCVTLQAQQPPILGSPRRLLVAQSRSPATGSL
jgi:hypothetical protein